MRTRRAFVAVLLLTTFAFAYSPPPSKAAPTAEQLAPNLRAFAASDDDLVQQGSKVPVVAGLARTGEIAVGDVIGDAANELIIGADDGKVYVRLANGTLTSFTPFLGYDGPLFVATGNLDLDPFAEIVAAVGSGAPPRYRIFNAEGLPVAAEVQPFAAGFDGGVRVAVGNVLGDAANEVVVGAGRGGGPIVRKFDASGTEVGAGFFAYAPDASGGVFVATGNLDGDALDEILVGPGASSFAKQSRAFNDDNSEVTLPPRTLPPLGSQPDVRVAIGAINGVPSWAETQRHGSDSEIDTFAISDGKFRRADPPDAYGALSVAITGGRVITLDTGPRLITLSPNPLLDHTRNNVTLYTGGLDLLDPIVTIGTASEGFEVETTRNGDDLTFSFPVPAGVEDQGVPITLGNPDDPRAILEEELFTVKGHNPPLDAFVTTGVGRAGGPHVRTFTSSGPRGGGFFAGVAPSGGVRVARGDLDNNGIDEIVTVNGPGTAPVVRIFNRDGVPIGSFAAYDEAFRGGLFVAVGDIDGDGINDIVTAPDAGGGPHVKVFGANGSLRSQFMAYPTSFTGGVRVAAADVDGDQNDEVVTGPGPGGGPHVRVLGPNGGVVQEFFAYAANFSGGVFVAGADVLGGGFDVVVVGPGAGGGPHVRAFFNGEELYGFMAYDPRFTGGVTVGRVGDDILGPNLVVVGPGPGGGPHVKLFDGPTEIDGFMAYDPSFTGGVFVAGGVAN